MNLFDRERTISIVAIAVLLIAAQVIALAEYFGIADHKENSFQNHTVCTQEAKLCPDGSTVGRTGPNCEFAECPTLNVGQEQIDPMNWKTYRNEEYGFEVRYPVEWYVWNALDGYKELVTGDERIIEIGTLSQFNDRTSLIGSVSITIWDNKSYAFLIENPEKVLALNQQESMPIVYSRKESQISGEKALILETVLDYEVGELIAVNSGNYIYIIYFPYIGTTHEQIDKILSTFKFIE